MRRYAMIDEILLNFSDKSRRNWKADRVNFRMDWFTGHSLNTVLESVDPYKGRHL